jgi:hypothetical protein
VCHRQDVLRAKLSLEPWQRALLQLHAAAMIRCTCITQCASPPRLQEVARQADPRSQARCKERAQRIQRRMVRAQAARPPSSAAHHQHLPAAHISSCHVPLPHPCCMPLPPWRHSSRKTAVTVPPAQLHSAAPSSSSTAATTRLPQDQARLRRHVHHQHGGPGGHAAAGALLGGCCCCTRCPLRTGSQPAAAQSVLHVPNKPRPVPFSLQPWLPPCSFTCVT